MILPENRLQKTLDAALSTGADFADVNESTCWRRVLVKMSLRGHAVHEMNR